MSQPLQSTRQSLLNALQSAAAAPATESPNNGRRNSFKRNRSALASSAASLQAFDALVQLSDSSFLDVAAFVDSATLCSLARTCRRARDLVYSAASWTARRVDLDTPERIRAIAAAPYARHVRSAHIESADKVDTREFACALAAMPALAHLSVQAQWASDDLAEALASCAGCALRSLRSLNVRSGAGKCDALIAACPRLRSLKGSAAVGAVPLQQLPPALTEFRGDLARLRAIAQSPSRGTLESAN
eukprot:m51a1_g1423 hypothetical protein (246) ;mRNA; r:60712-62026